MNEKLIMAILPLCTFLFAFGGYRQKVWRRFVLPIALGGLLYFFTEIENTKILISTLCCIGVFHFGYGDNSSWLKRFTTFASYSIPSLIFGFTIWQIINPFIFMGLFVMSRKNQLLWKSWESIVGLLIGVCLIQSIGG